MLDCGGKLIAPYDTSTAGGSEGGGKGKKNKKKGKGKGTAKVFARAGGVVQLVGLAEPISAGTEVLTANDVEHAKDVVEYRLRALEEGAIGQRQQRRTFEHVGLVSTPSRRSARFRQPPPRAAPAALPGASTPLEVPIILRADCDGSLATIQAMVAAFPPLEVSVASAPESGGGRGRGAVDSADDTERIFAPTVQIVDALVGPPSEADVQRAATFGAVLLCFGVQPSANVRTEATKETVEVQQCVRVWWCRFCVSTSFSLARVCAHRQRRRRSLSLSLSLSRSFACSLPPSSPHTRTFGVRSAMI